MSAPKQDKILGLPDDVSVDEIETAESGTLTASDERLIQRFEEIDTNAIERLTMGGKRLVEWGTAAIGIFFASLALLDNPQVQTAFQQNLPRTIGILAVVGYLLAILCGFFTSIPMRFRYRSHSLTDMERTLRRIFDRKYVLLLSGSAFFVAGSVLLGILIVVILLSI